MGDYMIKVVYVDDEPILRDAVKRTLEVDSDISVTTFDNPKDALEYLKNNSVDAVVSDFMMEPEDGVSFLIKVRIFNPSLPFIILTGRSTENVAIVALNEDADGFLKKGSVGVTMYKELGHMIRQSIEKRTSERSILKLKTYLVMLPPNTTTPE